MDHHIQISYWNKGNTVLLCCAILISIYFLPLTLHAATLYFEKPSGEYGIGDTLAVPLKLDTSGVAVNAISAEIIFPEALVSVSRIQDANSPVTLWIDPPKISGSSLSFAGIMPGGFTSVIEPETNTNVPATILTVIITVEKAGDGEINFSESNLYVNDGKGTRANLLAIPLLLHFNKEGSGKAYVIRDNIPPEAFTPLVTNDPNLYDGKYVLIWNTTDKESGIAYYEVKEGNGPWMRAQSPFVLADQTMKGSIKVKAVDQAGNIRIGSTGTAPQFPISIFIIPALLILILLLILRRVYTKHIRRKI